MSRFVLAMLVIAAVAGGGYFCFNYQVETQYDSGKLVGVKIVPRPGRGGGDAAWQPADLPPPRAPHATVRIASFNLDGLDEHKLSNRRVADVLVRLVPQFEILAVQGIRGQNQGVLMRLVEQIQAAGGKRYDFAIAPSVPREGVGQYNAFLFDPTAVEVDRSTVYTVEDTAGRFRHPPLVALFRVRGPAASEAFTFQLINVQTDPQQAAAELDLLADVFKAVRDDGRNEDDIIMLGDFAADENHLGRLAAIPGLCAAITSAPTTVRGTRRADNILFDRRATIEFTGRAEVFDLMRECDLTVEEALEVSEHLPVWAEFTSYEGGQQGHVAEQAGAVRR
jgi:exonuclease III